MSTIDDLTEQLKRELAISEARCQAANDRLKALQEVNAGIEGAVGVAENLPVNSGEENEAGFGGIVVSDDVNNLIDTVSAANTTPNGAVVTPPRTPVANQSSGPERTDKLTGLKYTNEAEFYSSMGYALQATANFQLTLRDTTVLFTKFRPLNFAVSNLRGEKGVKKLKAIFEKLGPDAPERELFLSFRVANSAIVNPTAQFGFTIAHILALRGEVEMFEYMVSQGIRVYERDLTGRMPLHVLAAVENKKPGHTTVCRMLIDKMAAVFGAKPVGPNAPVDNSGLTPCGWLQGNLPSKELKDLLHQPGDMSVSKSLRRPELGSADADHVGRGEFSSFAEASLPGWKYSMEDAFCAHPEVKFPDGVGTCDVYAVFDGHGGADVAKFCSENLLKILTQTPGFIAEGRPGSDLAGALTRACLQLDAAVVAEEAIRLQGSTGVIVVITENQILCANVGDCRVVLEQRGHGNEAEGPETAIALTNDHTFKNEQEFERLKAVGAELDMKNSRVVYRFADPEDEEDVTIKRVEPTRTFGNAMSKLRLIPSSLGGGYEPTDPHTHALTAEPEISVHARVDADRFLVVACDGVWDVMENNDVSVLLQQQFDTEGTGASASASTSAADTRDTLRLLDSSREILATSLERGSGDNMTVLVIGLAQATAKELKKHLFD